jgi:hypothetical protein
MESFLANEKGGFVSNAQKAVHKLEAIAKKIANNPCPHPKNCLKISKKFLKLLEDAPYEREANEKAARVSFELKESLFRIANNSALKTSVRDAALRAAVEVDGKAFWRKAGGCGGA